MLKNNYISDDNIVKNRDKSPKKLKEITRNDNNKPKIEEFHLVKEP